MLANNNDLLSAAEIVAGCTVQVAVGLQGHPVGSVGGWRGNFYAKSTPCSVAQSEEGQVLFCCCTLRALCGVGLGVVSRGAARGSRLVISASAGWCRPSFLARCTPS